MKSLIILLLLMIAKSGIAQIKASKIDSAAVPKYIKYKGGLDTAVRYTDKDGEHIIITSEDFKENDDAKSAYLYAYCYKVAGNSAKLEWQLYDLIEDCTVDITSDFLPKTFAITDLNHDGLAEVWIMYKNACRGDVSGSTMKVIMHEGIKKYAMRGTCRVKINGTDYAGGNYTFDEVFKAGPETYRLYAQQLWKKHVNETSFGL